MSSEKSVLDESVKRIKNFMLKRHPIKFVALTGSGISKGSGIPTFRGNDGLWKNYNAMDLATPQAFQRNPQLVWEWYAWRIDIISSKKPNPAHYALVDLQQKGLLYYIITQNVDSLHFRSGLKNLLEVHGNIFRTRCEKCGKLSLLTEAPEEPPICDCGIMVRPDVVWFGETLDQKIITKAYDIISHECDVLLVIGTSGIVYPTAEFPFIAKSHGALVLEFNLEKTPISRIADFTIIGKSEETLPIFVEKILTD